MEIFSFNIYLEKNYLKLIVMKAHSNKGGGKRGHNVADTLLRTQMFPRLPVRATFVVRDTRNVSDFCQKHFVSATNVSPFAQHGHKTNA